MTENARRITHTPAEVSRLTVEQLERIKEYQGIKVGIPNVDDYLTPGRPGELITVIGRPGHMKTGWMMRWARYLAEQIQDEGEEDKECIVFASWEMAVEELVLFDFAYTLGIAADDMAKGDIPLDSKEMMNVIKVRSTTPIYVIGPSLEYRRQQLRYAMPDILEALEYIEDEWDLRPKAVFLDYLQAMAPPNNEKRRIQVEENVRLAKQAALTMGCPVIMGCQAKREVDNKRIKLPMQGDGMETSAIEHVSDKILGLWRPIKTETGRTLPEPWGDKPITESLLMMAVAKQRFGPAGRIFPLYADPGKNTIGMMHVNPDGSWG